MIDPIRSLQCRIGKLRAKARREASPIMRARCLSAVRLLERELAALRAGLVD